MLIPALF